MWLYTHLASYPGLPHTHKKVLIYYVWERSRYEANMHADLIPMHAVTVAEALMHDIIHAIIAMENT